MKPRKRSITARIAAQRLWVVFAQYIKKRDGGVCISCGRKGLSGHQYNAGHMFSAARYPAIRYDEMCVHGQCARCNCFLFGNYIEYAQRFKEKYGQAEYDRLFAIRNNVRQWRAHELLELAEEYKTKLSALTGGTKTKKIRKSRTRRESK